jgi:hypothetical protein
MVNVVAPQRRRMCGALQVVRANGTLKAAQERSLWLPITVTERQSVLDLKLNLG